MRAWYGNWKSWTDTLKIWTLTIRRLKVALGYIFKRPSWEVIVLGYDSEEAAIQAFERQYPSEKPYELETLQSPCMIERELE